jgi:hypothetical protein
MNKGMTTHFLSNAQSRKSASNRKFQRLHTLRSSIPLIGSAWLQIILAIAAMLLANPSICVAGSPVTNGLRLSLQADAINPNDPLQVQQQGANLTVKNWLDQSGNGFNATQSGASLQPIFVPNALNGKPIVRFNGVNSFLSTTLAQISGNKSIFVVQRRTATTAGKEICSAGSNGHFLGNNGSLETKGRIGIAHDLSLAGNLNSAILKSYIRNGTAETLRVADAIVNGNAPDFAYSNYTISNSASPFAGDIAEVLIYNRALSDTERQSVESYLTNKWLPTTIPVTSGLQFWLDASAINPNDSSQVVTSGNAFYVKDWRDLSANSLHATQTATGNQPQYVASAINGKASVRFNGTTNFLSTLLPQIAGDKTIFIVQNRTSTVVGTELSSDSQYYGNFLANDGSTEAKGRLNVAYDLELPATINSPAVKCFMRSGGTETLSLNDTSISGSFPDMASGNYTISSSSYPFSGDIAEIIIFNRALTDAERQSVQNYLKAKWSVYGPPVPVTSGLQLWLDASALNSNDPNRVTTSGGNIYARDWLDRSSNSFHVTQTTTTYQPLYVVNALNGRPVLRFNGTNSFMTTPLQEISGDKSIFIVQRRSSTTSGKEISSTAASGDFLGNNVGLETKGRIGVAHDLTITGNLNNPILKSFIRSGTSETLRVDYQSASGSPPDVANGTYTISSSASPFAGDIAEVLIYNRALGDQERSLVENYLRNKWSASKYAVPVTSGLSLWLDASAINPSDPNQVVSANGNLYVQNWNDRSINRLQATQSVSSYQPLYVPGVIYGSPVVRFNGTSNFLATPLPQFVGDKSIFIVQRRTSNISAGTEIASNGSGGIFMGNNAANETAGRLYVAHDLSLPGGPNSPILKSLILSGTTETLRVDASSVSGTTVDSSGGNFTISNLSYPFAGDIAEVLIYNRALTDTERQSVENYLNSKWYIYPLNDIRSVLPDLTPPPMSLGAPAPGVRVKQTSPEYAGTNVYHTLYLPTDWQPGVKYPVIIDYGGNALTPSQTTDISCTGNVEDISLGYGITGGAGYIWICMPTIGGSPLSNQQTWWGDINATVDYCQKTVRHVCEDYGGDPSAVIVSGFSRGAIGCNYAGLNDDTTADIWLAFIPHSHYDGVITTWPYPNADAASALTRLQRLHGRYQFLSQETTNTANTQAYLQSLGVDMTPFSFNTLPYVNHTDIWTLRPIPLRQTVRSWLQSVVANRPGTHSIQGQVTNLAGTPIAGARIQSGYTHFTFTDANGNYVLAGLIDSTRNVTVTASGYTFTVQTVTVSGSNVTNVNFQSAQ